MRMGDADKCQGCERRNSGAAYRILYKAEAHLLSEEVARGVTSESAWPYIINICFEEIQNTGPSSLGQQSSE
jgi:hypothetical protein